MVFIDRIRHTVSKYGMLRQGDTVVVGLSGGADSVSLIHVLTSLDKGLNLYAVYVDHGLRPSETPDEIGFCEDLCKGLGVPFIMEQISFPPKIIANTQDTLRELRYEILEKFAYERKAARIAVGHNKDDQSETVLLHLIRGSALSGLGGIPPTRGKIIRPLIESSRADIERFLGSIGAKFITDSSNLTHKYMRNKVRLTLMPLLKEYNPNIVDTLSRNADIIRDEDRYMDRLAIKKTMTLISRRMQHRLELFLTPLQNLEKPILRRVLMTALSSVENLKGIGAVHIDDIIALIKDASTGASIDLPKGIRAIKGYSVVTITTEEKIERINTYSMNIPGELIIEEAAVVIRAAPTDEIEDETNRNIIVVDALKLKTPLTVRSRQDGDFFYPVGFGRRKKVQDFFVDEKVPKDARDVVPLIFSGDDLVWIAGMRGDERFKPAAETRQLVKLQLFQLKA